MNALLSFVEVPLPSGSRGQKRTLDETQTPEAPTDSTASLASLDDWFAGTQFEAARPSFQPNPAQTNDFTGGLDDPTVWAASELRANGAPNTLFAALGYGASVDEHFLPLDGWNGNDDGQNDLARLFGFGLGAGSGS